MTGFGRGVTTTKSYQLTVEIRSVNHRYLEIHSKFPKEWYEAELLAKKIISKDIKRGKLDVVVNVKTIGQDVGNIQINWPLIEEYKHAKEQLQKMIPMEEKYTMNELLSLESAISYEKKELSTEELLHAVESAVVEAVEQLVEMRKREGKELKSVISQYHVELKKQVEEIRIDSPNAVQKYRERLAERIAEITISEQIDDRLLAEVALFAERIDISEELDRLASHFKQLEETLEQSSSIGRKLDFLMQEILREVNTIGSKNQSTKSAIAVVEAKTIIEKMREQVQNIE